MSGLANGWQQHLWRTKGPPLRGGEEKTRGGRETDIETISLRVDFVCAIWGHFLATGGRSCATTSRWCQPTKLRWWGCFSKKSLFDLSSKSISNSLQCHFWLPASLVEMKKVPRSQPEAFNSWKLLWNSSSGWLVGTFFHFGTEQEGGRAAVKDSLKTYHNLRKNAKKKTIV